MKTVKGQKAVLRVYNAEVDAAHMSIHEMMEQLLRALTRSHVQSLAYAAELELEAFKLDH